MQTEKHYTDLSDRLKIKDSLVIDGRYGVSPRQYLGYIDSIIGQVTGGLTSAEFGDTVFIHDAWEDGLNPVDTAEEILLNDTLGQLFLADFLGWEEKE